MRNKRVHFVIVPGPMLATLILKLNFVARNFSRILQGSAEEMLHITFWRRCIVEKMY